jgi:hypothetical protein
MRVIDEHHHYELDYFEDSGGEGHHVRFIKKELDPTAQQGSGVLRTVYNGTTNEEVLKMLIHRLTALGEKFPCAENEIATELLKDALEQLEKRTAERKARGVEGKALA